MSHEKFQKVINALNHCATLCNHCISGCLDESNVQMLSQCIKLDIDCAQVCNVTASLLARGSKHGEHLMKECAEICDACAAECDKHAIKHDHCKLCAEACRACAEACRSMA